MEGAERALLSLRVQQRLEFMRSGAIGGATTLCVLLSGCGGCLTCAITTSLSTGATATGLAALAGLVLGAVIVLNESRRCRQLQRAATLDLERGVVEEATFDATRAAAPMCDNMHILLLDVGSQTLLLLWGDHLEEPLRSRAFPSSRFTIIRAPRCGLHLKVVPGGDLLEIESADFRDGDDVDFGPEDGHLFPGSIDTLHADLEAWFASRRRQRR